MTYSLQLQDDITAQHDGWIEMYRRESLGKFDDNRDDHENCARTVDLSACN